MRYKHRNAFCGYGQEQYNLLEDFKGFYMHLFHFAFPCREYILWGSCYTSWALIFWHRGQLLGAFVISSIKYYNSHHSGSALSVLFISNILALQNVKIAIVEWCDGTPQPHSTWSWRLWHAETFSCSLLRASLDFVVFGYVCGRRKKGCCFVVQGPAYIIRQGDGELNIISNQLFFLTLFLPSILTVQAFLAFFAVYL